MKGAWLAVVKGVVIAAVAVALAVLVNGLAGRDDLSVGVGGAPASFDNQREE